MSIEPSERLSRPFFDQFSIGQEILTACRTITEADILQFASLSGDFSPIHLDAEYSRLSPSGERIAHGMLVASIASGLAVQTGHLEGIPIYFREISEWKFIKPVFIGDTIHARLIVSEMKALRKLDGGLIQLKVDVFNQGQVVVQRGRFVILVGAQ